MARILMVGHDNLCTSACKGVCRERGHTVAVVRHSTEAVVYLGREAVDLVVIDGTMPGKEGAALLDAMRRLGPQGQVPVILLAAVPEPWRDGGDAWVVPKAECPRALEAAMAKLPLRGTASSQSR